MSGHINLYPANAEIDIAFATSTEPGQPAQISLTRLYTVGWPTSRFNLDVYKNDNGHILKWKLDYSI